MQVRCSLCGRVEEIGKWSADYDRVRLGEPTHVCQSCQRRVQSEALRATREPKPL